MSLWHVNRLQGRPGGLFHRTQHMEQCPGGGSPNSFVLIMQGGFEIRNNLSVADMTKGTESDDSWPGKRILGETRQQRDGLPTIRGACLPHGKSSRRP